MPLGNPLLANEALKLAKGAAAGVLHFVDSGWVGQGAIAPEPPVEPVPLPITAKKPVTATAPEKVVATTAPEQPVGTGPAVKHVRAWPSAEEVVPTPATYGIRSEPAREDVVALAAKQGVPTRFAEKQRAAGSNQEISPARADEDVASPSGTQRVIAAPAAQDIRSGCADDPVRAGGPGLGAAKRLPVNIEIVASTRQPAKPGSVWVDEMDRVVAAGEVASS